LATIRDFGHYRWTAPTPDSPQRARAEMLLSVVGRQWPLSGSGQLRGSTGDAGLERGQVADAGGGDHQGAVLGDDCVDVGLNVGEYGAQLVHHTPGDQDHPDPLSPRLAQRGQRVEPDGSVGQGAVEVDRHRPEVAGCPGVLRWPGSATAAVSVPSTVQVHRRVLPHAESMIPVRFAHKSRTSQAELDHTDRGCRPDGLGRDGGLNWPMTSFVVRGPVTECQKSGPLGCVLADDLLAPGGTKA
jgi:hypothetical protein